MRSLRHCNPLIKTHLNLQINLHFHLNIYYLTLLEWSSSLQINFSQKSHFTQQCILKATGRGRGHEGMLLTQEHIHAFHKGTGGTMTYLHFSGPRIFWGELPYIWTGWEYLSRIKCVMMNEQMKE